MRPSQLIVAAFVGALYASGVAAAQGERASAAIDLAHQPENLRPGDWVWAPDASPEGPVAVLVDLSRQLATVYRNGVRIGVATISSGRRRHETPTGVFTVLQKDLHHRSSKYNNARMPFQLRLTEDGVALHAGGLPGYPESHGCVHLPYAFAQRLFQIVSIGVAVVMTGAPGERVDGAGAGLLAPIDAAGTARDHRPLDNADYRWTPEASPGGPISIILSRASQEAVVLRNGLEIGRAHATIPTDNQATLTVTMSRGASGQPLWRRIGADGASAEALPLNTIIAGVSIPEPFLAALWAALEPGATMLITPAPVEGALPRATAAAAGEPADPTGQPR